MSTVSSPSSKDYWNRVAPGYDRAFPETAIGQAQREAVYEVLDRTFHAGQRILELNCGTGIDAVHLAENGVSVLACDLADGMIEMARRRAHASPARELIDFRALPTEGIADLGGQAPFDGVFSNFSGLNHVADLRGFARNVAALLKPDASALFCVAGCFSPAETVWCLLHGDLSGALRRLTRRTDDASLQVHYLSARAMARVLSPEFRLREWMGVGITLPSCAEGVARRFPKAFERVAPFDRRLGRVPGLRGLADCTLLTFGRAGR
jgi:SAM-dependent methyltransferase